VEWVPDNRCAISGMTAVGNWLAFPTRLKDPRVKPEDDDGGWGAVSLLPVSTASCFETIGARAPIPQ
jgi:hypothetical protein